MIGPMDRLAYLSALVFVIGGCGGNSQLGSDDRPDAGPVAVDASGPDALDSVADVGPDAPVQPDTAPDTAPDTVADVAPDAPVQPDTARDVAWVAGEVSLIDVGCKATMVGSVPYDGGVDAEPTCVVTQFSVPWPNSQLIAGPDGNLWLGGNLDIARMSPTGTVTVFHLPGAKRVPSWDRGASTSLTGGPDGNIWFTEYYGNNIGRITPDGDLTEFAIPDGTDQWVPYGESVTKVWTSTPHGIAPGPDGNLWFAKGPGRSLASITPLGVITSSPIPYDPAATIASIVTGPDGNLWFSETTSGGLWSGEPYDASNVNTPMGRLSPDGVYLNFSIGNNVTSAASNLIAGADGNLWFIGSSPSTVFVGRLEPGTLELTEFPVRPSPTGWRPLVVSAPDGELWFMDAGHIGRVTSAGSITRCLLPDTSSTVPYYPTEPWWIAVGPDGNLWFSTSIKLGSGYAVGYVSRW